jgi:hypothetical protein
MGELQMQTTKQPTAEDIRSDLLALGVRHLIRAEAAFAEGCSGAAERHLRNYNVLSEGEK